MHRAWPLLVLASILAGCADAPARKAGERVEWRAGGAFLPGYTKEDRDAICAIILERRDVCEFAMSDPPGFVLILPSEAACRHTRARADAVPHTRLGECAKVVLT